MNCPRDAVRTSTCARWGARPRGRRLVLVCGSLAVGAIVSAAWFQHRDPPAFVPAHGETTHSYGALEPVGETHVDMGDHRLGAGEDLATVVWPFSFRNVGHRTVEILAVRTTCSCASASIDTSSIEPGEVVTVTVTAKLASTMRVSVLAQLVLDDGAVVECGLRAATLSACRVVIDHERVTFDAERRVAMIPLLAIGECATSAEVPFELVTSVRDQHFDGWVVVADRLGDAANLLTGTLTIALGEDRSDRGVSLRQGGGRPEWVRLHREQNAADVGELPPTRTTR